MEWSKHNNNINPSAHMKAQSIKEYKMTRGSAPTHGPHGQERERKGRRLPGTARGSRSDRRLSSVQRSKMRQSRQCQKKEARRGRHLAKVSDSARGFVSDKDKRERWVGLWISAVAKWERWTQWLQHGQHKVKAEGVADEAGSCLAWFVRERDHYRPCL
jgi:hypothetical protein